jgi:hypothetical protein
MVRYFYAWTPLVIVGTVVLLSLPWLGLIALMIASLVALAALAALAWRSSSCPTRSAGQSVAAGTYAVTRVHGRWRPCRRPGVLARGDSTSEQFELLVDLASGRPFHRTAMYARWKGPRRSCRRPAT